MKPRERREQTKKNLPRAKTQERMKTEAAAAAAAAAAPPAAPAEARRRRLQLPDGDCLMSGDRVLLGRRRGAARACAVWYASRASPTIR